MSKFYDKYPILIDQKQEIDEIIDCICEMYSRNKKLLVCGNGGNCADSDHIVGELMKGFRLNRSIDDINKYGEIGIRLQEAIKAISLTSHASLITAISNDTGADMIFAQQVYGYGEVGDVLFCLSTSGKSTNVLNATKVAKTMGLKVVSIVGKDGGSLKELSDICIHIPNYETYEIQEYMLPIYHYICMKVEQICFK